MGNLQGEGFTTVPETFFKNLRKKTDKRYQSTVVSQRRRSEGSMLHQERGPEGTNEITSESVTVFLASNPDFLDQYVYLRVSQDRVQAWIKPTQESNEVLAATDGEARALDSVSELDYPQNSSTDIPPGSRVKTSSDDDVQPQGEEEVPDIPAIKPKILEKCNKEIKHLRKQLYMMVYNRDSWIYPRKYKQEELSDLIERPTSTYDTSELDSHIFSYTKVPVDDISKIFIKMAQNLMGESVFPMRKLIYFLSTLRANYNKVEYHDYHHAFSHAQSMYWILKKNPGAFSELEMKALLIASLSHDVGHPGIDEYFMKKIGMGLQVMYDNPLLENHHTQICFQILQDVDCNVFCDLDPQDYKKVLDEIKHAILSTPFDRYKSQVVKLRQMMETGSNLQNEEMRDSVKSLMMMACDLCGTWKRWEEHLIIVGKLYEEFFNQSDLEAHFNIPSKPYQMRSAATLIPQSQVSFMESIANPVFKLLSDIFPPMLPIIKASKSNMAVWKTR